MQAPFCLMPPPLSAIGGHNALTCDALPGLVFPVRPDHKLALASRRLNQPVIQINADQNLRKLYLLVLPFVENHDTFTRCARVTVTAELKPDRPPFDASEEPVGMSRPRYPQVIIERTLTTPGDLDSFLSEHAVGPFATARQTRPDRYGLLPLLTAGMGDWAEGQPLPDPYGMFPMLNEPPRNRWLEGEFQSFPQPRYWSSSPAIRTDSATFNVVELDLGEVRRVKRIEITSLLQDTAIGCVSILGLTGEQNSQDLKR
jgi:hypothetical protein